MEKEVYFSHDANAMSDPKCMLLVSQLGMEGYGIFWALVEFLRLQKGYRAPLALLPALARKFDASPAKVEAVIRSYNLFVIDDQNQFFSESLDRRMAMMERKTEQRKLASAKANAVRWSRAIAAGNASYRNPNGVQAESDPTPNASQLNEIKLNNKKENRVKEKVATFVAPSLSEIEEYVKAKNLPVDANRFFCFYESKGWMIGKNKMKNWHMALSTWVRRDNQVGNESIRENTQSVYDGCLQ